jgi:hypothetical protein
MLRKGLLFFGTPHKGGNTDSNMIKMGFIAAKIAQFLGFSINDSIVQALKPGSLFVDILKEAFRHQLEQYFIVSFWEQKLEVGLPALRITYTTYIL